MSIRTSCKITLLAMLTSLSAYADVLDLRIIETTDIHSNMMDFDYYQNKPTEQYGLIRTASLIEQARKEVKNTILVDNGDLIQGSPLADQYMSEGANAEPIHPVYKVMNNLDYTVANIGNHEFNYGLQFLNNALTGANFPYINSNVFDANTGKPYFQQQLIVETPVVDRNGKYHTLKIAYLGFVPPQIMLWDRTNLEGKVTVKDITEVAKEMVPKLKKEGADLVIVIAHSGISADEYKTMAENSVYYLSHIEGIDAILFGHSHGVFPSNEYLSFPGFDVEKGTLNGIPAVMPGQWGSHIGVVDLVIEGKKDQWKVTSSKAEARPIFDKKTNKAVVTADKKYLALIEADHKKVLDFVNQPVGRTKQDFYSFLALVQDDPTVKVINDAQKAYVENYIKDLPELAKLPVLSAAAPFKAGGRKNDPTSYVQVDKGELTFRNAADLYLFSNTLAIVKVTGAQVQEWLECSAGQFNQINTELSDPQFLLNWKDFRTYNFDVIDGVTYKIDLTQPARYNGNCEMINANASRIRDLIWQGKAIDPKAEFLIATNNYRADSGRFPGTAKENLVYASAEEVRSILADYITAQTRDKGELSVILNQNWSFVPLKTNKQLDIRFETSPSQKAANFINEQKNNKFKYLEIDKEGFAIYQIDLQKP